MNYCDCLVGIFHKNNTTPKFLNLQYGIFETINDDILIFCPCFFPNYNPSNLIIWTCCIHAFSPLLGQNYHKTIFLTIDSYFLFDAAKISYQFTLVNMHQNLDKNTNVLPRTALAGNNI